MVRRTPSATRDGDIFISSKIAIGLKLGTVTTVGTISVSKKAISGSGRRRPRGAEFFDGNRGSLSIWYAVFRLIAARAAEAGLFSVNLDFMYSIIW